MGDYACSDRIIAESTFKLPCLTVLGNPVLQIEVLLARLLPDGHQQLAFRLVHVECRRLRTSCACHAEIS